MRFLILFLAIILFSWPNSAYANAYLTKNESWDLGMTGSSWTSIVLGDIDNDDFQDLVQIGCTSTTGGTQCDGYLVKVYINNGTSLVENSAWESNLTAVHYGSLALGDIDNDGDLDLALSGCKNGGGSVSACVNAIGHYSAIYINNGTSFVESTVWKGDLQDVWKSSFAFGDVDLDGKLDLVVSGGSNTAVIATIYINNGTAFKENSIWSQELVGVYGSSTTLVDIDNDGDLDLTIVGDTTSIGYIARAYTNNGTTFIRNATWDSVILGVELTSTVWGDFDNNGRMDFSLIGHTSSDEHEIYNNTGSGLTRINKNSPYGNLAGIFEGTQALGDYDNDGKIDLFTSGEEQWSTLYINTGGNFTGYGSDPESDIFNTAYGPGSVWVDIDNDSDLDLILVGWNYGKQRLNATIYTNNITTKNTAPLPPNTLTTNYSNGILNLSWSAGSDTETPILGLYYNLRIGNSSGGHQIVTGVYGGGDDNGYFGNMMQRRNILLRLPNLTGTIYWSVQTIDTGLKAGSWASERTYTINSSSSNQTNDTAAPNITITSPVNTSEHSTSTISVTATYLDNNTVTCQYKLDSSSYSSMSGGGSANGTVSATLSSVPNGQHTVHVNCTDNRNNSAVKNATFTVNVISAPPPPTGSSSSGGGGGTGAQPVTATNSTNQSNPIIETKTSGIEPGEVRIVEIANPVIKKVSMEVRNSVGNVVFSAERITEPEIEAPSGNIYSYIEISHQNFTNEDVKTASLSFVVDKSWIGINNINKTTVRLNRYSDGWTTLNTTLLIENSTSITYEAVSPGFSLFAVTGEKNMKAYVDVDYSGYYFLVGVIVLLFAGVCAYLHHRRLKNLAPQALSS